MYQRFCSTSGLSTKHWGGPAWYFLFSCVMSYPPQIEPNNVNHKEIQKQFKLMFTSLGFTMPCIHCRNSYKQFMNELPIDSFLIGRIELMRWLYTIRDKVNNKLIKQEYDKYNKLKKEYKKMFYNGELSRQQYYSNVQHAKLTTLQTKPSPPFLNVLEKYESIRANCSQKTCSIQK